MKRSRIVRWLESPLLWLWLLILPAITPLVQPTITHSADGLLHLYRVVALDHAFQQGVLFPRWFPDLVYGYGLPLFVFYAPLSYYLTEAWRLIGLSFTSAFNASLVLALLLSGSGVYLLVKDRFGPKAGVLAGVAYVYAPYQLYNVLWRGSLPIAWAGALLPYAFWTFGRLIRANRPIYLPLSALACAAILLSHNISGLLFLPLLLLYLAVELFGRPHWPKTTAQPAGWQWSTGAWRVGAALVLGLALSAFFLGPAILEKGFIQVERVITPPDFDYHFNFASLSELFLLPPPANTGLLNPEEPLMLGLIQAALAVVGLLGVWRLPAAGQRRTVFFAGLGLAAVLFFMLPFSVGVWEQLPLLAYVQQPHRLLSLAAFLLAILLGAAVAAQYTLPRLQTGLVWLGSGLMIITAVPLLYPRYYDPLPAALSLPGMMAYERASGAIGTTSFGEYLPVWVQWAPAESPLEAMYRSGRAIERLEQSYLPAGAGIESATYGFNQADLVITAPQPYQAVFHTFYFPGWEAQVDGRPAVVQPVSERGLLSVVMPAGRHRLLLRFRETPVRQAADGLSALALAAVLILFFKFRRIASADVSSSPFAPGPTRDQASFTRSQLIGLAVVAIALIAAKALYLDRFDNPLKHTFDGVQVAGVVAPTRVNFGRQINMLGYSLKQSTVIPGQSFEITLFWQARQPLATNYSALAQLVDDQDHLYAGQDNLHPGNLPVSWWEPWGFVQDTHRVKVPAGTPPGAYFLAVGLYDPATWARLPVVEGGSPGWSDVLAMPVTVLKPDRPPALTELAIAWPVGKEIAPALQLLGATPERDNIGRNDFLRLALFWEATSAPLPDYQISLRLLAADGAVVLARTSRPSHGRYPTGDWSAGECVRDNHALWVPADFPPGVYQVQVQVLDGAGRAAGDWLELGRLKAGT